MNHPTAERTPLIIAAEINAINQESRRMLLKNAIEIGRRLKEAKTLLKHGEWLKWLKESVSYSKSTAENMTTRELQQALKDRGQAKQENDPVPQENKGSQERKSGASTITGLKKPAPAVPMPQSLPTHNLKTELDPNALTKYTERCDACREIIANAFFDLTTALTNLAYIDPAVKEKKRKEANQLIDALAETIKEWPPAKKPLKVIS